MIRSSISNTISGNKIKNCNRIWLKNKKVEEKQLVGETNNMGVTYERNKEDMVNELVNLKKRDQKKL